MNAKQKTVIATGVAVIVAMGLYPPVAISCGGYQYEWILPALLAPAEPACAENSPNGWTWELATDRLCLQWGLVFVATALLALALNGPNALEWLKDYQGATFRFTKYTARCGDWRYDHCAGCWATFAEQDGSGILHEAYVTGVRYDETSVGGTAPIFVCARCFNQCRDSLDFEVESPPTSASV